MPGGVFSGAKLHGIKIRESANDGSDFSNPEADYRLAFLGEDGLWHVKDSAGAVTSPFSAGTGTNLNPGTSFPGSPANNDLCYRTDRDILYFYDGTRWLSVDLYRHDINSLTTVQTTSGTTWGRIALWHTTYDVWLENFYCCTFTGATNTGAAFWTFALKKYQADFATSSTVASRATSADGANTTTTGEVAIGALFVPATYKVLQVEGTKTGSPSGIHFWGGVSYRLVG